MALDYWDCDTTSPTWGGSGSTTGTETADYYYVSAPVEWVKKIIVKTPKHWDKIKHAAWVKLVNQDTTTGWKVDMIIHGNILITDPSIEIREMNAFTVLMKETAGDLDKEKINEFFSDP